MYVQDVHTRALVNLGNFDVGPATKVADGYAIGLVPSVGEGYSRTIVSEEDYRAIWNDPELGRPLRENFQSATFWPKP